jgi:DNA-binding XRE family transcriptional regulator
MFPNSASAIPNVVVQQHNPDDAEEQMMSNVTALLAPEIFKKLRQGKGLTRQALANEIGCSAQAIVNYEKSGSKLSFDKFVLFLKVVAPDQHSLTEYAQIFRQLNSQVASDLVKAERVQY